MKDENLLETIRKKIDLLNLLQVDLAAFENAVKECKERIYILESQDLPALMDEFDLDEFTFQDGVKVKLADKTFTYVNVAERKKAWEQFNELGRRGVFKPSVYVVLAQTVGEPVIDALIASIKGAVEIEKIELSFDAHAGSLNANCNDLIDNGIELDSDVFKQSVKRGVKITQPKVSKQKSKR